MVLAMRQDVAACFTCKQVGLGFPSLASRLVEARHGWCMWHHRGGRVEVKRKTVGPMASGAAWCKLDENILY
jgi:hypothetical protein